MEVYRRNPKTGGRGPRMQETGEKVDKRVEIKAKGVKAYYEERQGCEYFSFRLLRVGTSSAQKGCTG